MKIKRKELNEIETGINLYDGQRLQDFKLTMLLVKNKKLIKNETEIFEEAKKKLLPTDDMEKYQKNRMELAKTFWKKDKDDNYEMETNNGQQVHVINDKNKLSGALESFDEKHKKLIDRYNKGYKEAESYLDEEIEIPLQKLTDLEKVEKLSHKTLSALAPIIGCNLPQKHLEKIGDGLKTSDLERIIEFCEIEETLVKTK